MNGTLIRFLDVGRSFCAAFIAYVAVGGLLGLALTSDAAPTSACWPRYGVFWAIYTSCDDPLMEPLWHGAVGIPRGFVVAPAASLFAIYTLFVDSTQKFAHIAVVGLTYTVPALAMAWIGFRHWLSHFPLAAWSLGLAYVGQVVVLAAELIGPTSA